MAARKRVVAVPGPRRRGGTLVRRRRAERALKAAEDLFSTLLETLTREAGRLEAANEAADCSCAQSLQGLTRQTQKALQSLLDLEATVLHERRRIDEAAGTAEGMLDLGAARDEIEGRLARLAAA